MTPFRAGTALVLLGVICLSVVYLRTEAVRLRARTVGHESQLIRLRREAWDVQMQSARLRSPQHIESQIQRMDLAFGSKSNSLLPPSGD